MLNGFNNTMYQYYFIIIMYFIIIKYYFKYIYIYNNISGLFDIFIFRS